MPEAGYLEFEIPGLPVPKGRPRAVKRGEFVRMYTPAKTKQWEQHVSAVTSRHAGSPFDGPVYCCITFWFPMQGQPLKTGSRPAIEKVSGPDVDNLAKSILDGMNGIAYHDDRQVYRLHVQKFHCPQTRDEPRVHVSLYAKEEAARNAPSRPSSCSPEQSP